MNKKKIVVGENFLHAYAASSSTITAGHAVVDYDDWKAVVDYFTDNDIRTEALATYVEEKKEETGQLVHESQKCDQGNPAVVKENETRDLVDIRKFALEQARLILNQNGKYAEGGTVMLLAKDIFDFIVEGS